MNWTMETVYLGCAAAGGTVLLVQTGMMLLGGGGHDGDVGHVDHSGIGHSGSGDQHGGDSGLSLLSVRSIAAFLTFFGLAGFGGTSSGWGTFQTMGAALAAGAVMLVAVAWIFSLQGRLYSQGNLDPSNAVGHTARVYLRIPGANSGKGKITVSIQGRTHEFSASTAGPEISTGREVKVVRQITQDTFEVEGLA
ncbi:MAG TPA: hypothetical protein VGR31_16975 [Planctomycetota bacterium]|jgi:hypothetical protein|nr:hypothetical protein [Planctomycetota bacterium]